MHREIQIKQFPIVTTHWWPKTWNERFVWENEQYLYRFLPLVHNHVQVIWVRTHIRCVTCVCECALAQRQRLTEGVSEAWCWRNFSSANGGVSQSDRLMQIPNPVHATQRSMWLVVVTMTARQHHASDTPSVKRWRRRPCECSVSQSARTHTFTHRMCVRTQITWTWLCKRGKKRYKILFVFSHKPLVCVLGQSMCSYDGELFNLDFSVHVLFPSYWGQWPIPAIIWWQTRTVWPKNIKLDLLKKKRHLHLGCPWVSW